MNRDMKTFVLNLVTVVLALEIRSFLDNGGWNNDLAFTLFKIVLFAMVCTGIIHMEDMTRIVIQTKDHKTVEGEDGAGVMSLTKILRATTRTYANK